MSQESKTDISIWKTIHKYRKRLTLSSIPIVLASLYYLRQIFSGVDLTSQTIPLVNFFSLEVPLYYMSLGISITVLVFLVVFFKYRSGKNEQIGNLNVETNKRTNKLQNDLNISHSSNAILTKEINGLNNKISDKESIISKKDIELKKLADKIRELERELTQTKRDYERLREENVDLTHKIKNLQKPQQKRID